jgi:FkbM family methyltransferase
VSGCQIHATELSEELQSLWANSPESYHEGLCARHPGLENVIGGKCSVVLYPAARLAQRAAAILKVRGVDVRGFGDGNSRLWGTTINGLPVVSPDSVGRLIPGGAVLTASSLYDSVIRERLLESGFSRIYSMPYLSYRLPDVFPSREYSQAMEAPFQPDARKAISRLFDMLADDESRRVLVAKLRFYLTLEKDLIETMRSTERIYFDPTIYSLHDDEIVVDGGAFRGDTLAQFLNACRGKFRRYYAFEPDPEVFETLKRVALSEPEKINCLRVGLFDKVGNVSFNVSGGVDTRIAEKSSAPSVRLPVLDLSSYFDSREPPTLIKMDIEGAETAALHGARALLKKASIRLAVSAYHSPKDLWEIPLIISDLVPNHRIFLRHYTREVDDTVCYGIP